MYGDRETGQPTAGYLRATPPQGEGILADEYEARRFAQAPVRGNGGGSALAAAMNALNVQLDYAEKALAALTERLGPLTRPVPTGASGIEKDLQAGSPLAQAVNAAVGRLSYLNTRIHALNESLDL